MQKAPTLTRQELQKLLVTDADAFTALRFLRHRENAPAVSELEESGGNQLPGFAGSLCDLYHVLWAETPAVREEIPADRRHWGEILKAAMSSTAYEQLHAQTQYSDLKSILGTLTMGQSVIENVSEKDKEKLQEAAEKQKDADEAEAEAGQAEAEASAANMLAEAAQAAQSGQSGTGQPSNQMGSGSGGMSLEEAQELANQFAAQAATARAKADAAKQAVETVVEDLLGQPGSDKAMDKLRELARVGIAAAKEAKEKVEEVSDTLESWGLEEGELIRKGIPKALGVLERMKKSEALRKFAALLGRLRQIAARKARSKEKAEGVRVTIPETGRDIKRAVNSELVSISHPALRTKALTRWARGELRLRGEQAKKKLGHGPVIVCEDASGSMDGLKQQWAKALVLAMAHYAKLQKRSFGWVMFDSVIHQSKTYPKGRIGAEQLLEIAESRAGGGTNFEAPVRKALEMIRKEGLKKADVCFITDGECAVSEEFLKEVKETVSGLEINIFAVLCDVGSVSDATVEQFAGRVDRVSSFTAETAEKVFQNL
ncbi:MAG: VWA domain-containing protein [bacterium]|nr:VWA domain-containing protein [bacterium]